MVDHQYYVKRRFNNLIRYGGVQVSKLRSVGYKSLGLGIRQIEVLSNLLTRKSVYVVLPNSYTEKKEVKYEAITNINLIIKVSIISYSSLQTASLKLLWRNTFNTSTCDMFVFERF